jgi:hypothetical protein
MARNDRLATARFASLKNAVERTAAEAGDSKGICDGSALRRHYSGPPFSDDAWRRIAGNYVKEDGYMFMLYCHETDGYKIDARPARVRGDGTRQLCCRVERNRTGHACLPCTK